MDTGKVTGDFVAEFLCSYMAEFHGLIAGVHGALTRRTY